MNKSPRLLLDTHAWLWLMSGTLEFAPIVQEQIEQAAQQHQVYISAISVWEVGLLESKGRIRLQMPCEAWVREALATPGLSLAPLTPEVISVKWLASTPTPWLR